MATMAGLLLTLSAALAGCESGQTASASPEQRAAAVPVHTEQYTKLGYRIDWRGFPSLFSGSQLKFFNVAGDVILAQDSSGVLSILEDRSGERRWSDQPAQALTKFTGNIRDDNRIICSSEAEAFVFDIETGNLLDKQRLEKVVNTRPAKVGDILVYGCSDGQVLGHLTLNGFRQWGSGLDGSIETDPVQFGDSSAVALVSSRGEILIIDGISGYSLARGRIFAGPGAELGSSDTSLFIASLDHSLYAISKDSASIIWRHRTEEPLRAAPVHHEGVVYCDLGTQGITAFNSATGKVLWQNTSARGVLTAIRKGRLVFWNAANSTATTIDPARGDIIDSVVLDKVTFLRAQPFVDGNLYGATANGVVIKLVPRN
jgi:outer membrane protein assembly factor BamB